MFKEGPNLSGEYIHYFSGDPAFDSSHADFNHAKWVETGDENYLPRRDGGPEPYKFTLRHLNRKQRYWLMNITEREGAMLSTYYAVALALKSVPFIPTEDGKKEDLRFSREGRYNIVCEEHMELFDGEVIAELGTRVWSELNGNPL